MLESAPIMILTGVLLGALAGIGVGGGSLLMLLLTLVLGMEHSAARALNLVFYLPSALIASFFRWKQGTLNYRKILPAVFAGAIAAAIFSIAGSHIETAALQKIFGGLLLITGIRELFYRPKNAI